MNLNKAFVLGNVTQDPQIRALPDGRPVANFGLATNRFYTDKTGEKKQQAEFHNIVAFGRNAEIVQQYVKRGSLLLVEGRLQTKNWQDQNGTKKYRTEIVVERLQLGPKSASYQSTPQTNENIKKPLEEEIPVIEEDNPSVDKKPQASSTEKPLENKIEDESQDDIDVKNIPF